MILPDVNVLINAIRPDAPDHRRSREWLESILNSPLPYGMSPQVLASVLRILTSRRLFKGAYPPDGILAFLTGLLERPNCRLISPGARHWEVFADLCTRTQATGDLVPDAWFAALAIEHDCEWITFDRDFARFPGLRWRTPF